MKYVLLTTVCLLGIGFLTFNEADDTVITDAPAPPPYSAEPATHSVVSGSTGFSGGSSGVSHSGHVRGVYRSRYSSGSSARMNHRERRVERMNRHYGSAGGAGGSAGFSAGKSVTHTRFKSVSSNCNCGSPTCNCNN